MRPSLKQSKILYIESVANAAQAAVAHGCLVALRGTARQQDAAIVAEGCPATFHLPKGYHSDPLNELGWYECNALFRKSGYQHFMMAAGAHLYSSGTSKSSPGAFLMGILAA